MNLFRPSTWPVFGRKQTEARSSAIARAGASLGIFQDTLGGFIPREVNPHLYESMREVLPILDGALNRLVTLDGIVRVEGDNDALVQEIERDLLESIPVNDAEAGLAAAYALQGNELYEQGFGVLEMVMDSRGRELIGLRCADSKGVAFSREPETLRMLWWYRPPAQASGTRRDGSDHVEAIIRRTGAASLASVLAQHNYAPLDPDRMIYAALSPESDNPYGTSLLRSMEFVTRIILQMQVATGNAWDRFGNPAFSVVYKTKNRTIGTDPKSLEARRSKIASDFAAVLDIKKQGNSGDFVMALHADDELAIKVIGDEGQALEIEQPARHLLEQVVSKTGVPAWLLGLQWTTAERLAQQQSEIVLQESKTRFERRRPGLRRIVETFLRGRGRTWKPGDWRLAQELPNLHDELKRAQADFLNAQTEFMRRGGDSGANAPPVAPGTDQGAAKRVRMLADGTLEFGAFEAPAIITTHKAAKAATEPEDFAEDDPALPEIEARAIEGLLTRWGELSAATLAALELPAKRAKAVVFEFSPLLRTVLSRLADEFEADVGAEDGALMRGMFDTWLRGAANAAADLSVEQALTEVSAAARDVMRTRALQYARSVTARTYRDDILEQLSAGAYDGQSPAQVARALRERFDVHDYDWGRLARSELAQQQVLGKEAEYAALGVTHYDYVTAGDSRVSAICRANAAGGPYAVGAGPLPMRDSHPNCRCSTRPRVDEV